MINVSWGSKGEVNATKPRFCVSGRQERHRKGRGWTVGWRDEDMEKVKGNWGEWPAAEHTHTHTPA